jgi:hypothetical protein
MILQARGGNCALPGQRRDGRAVLVEHDRLVAVPDQATSDVTAHPSQSYDADLHVGVISWRCGAAAFSIIPEL